MDYITFGSGERNLLILPGLGDGLKTVKGAAFPLSLLYRSFSNDFKVYVFSRKEPLEEQAGTREMAEDVRKAMDFLGIHKASVSWCFNGRHDCSASSSLMSGAD